MRSGLTSSRATRRSSSPCSASSISTRCTACSRSARMSSSSSSRSSSSLSWSTSSSRFSTTPTSPSQSNLPRTTSPATRSHSRCASASAGFADGSGSARSTLALRSCARLSENGSSRSAAWHGSGRRSASRPSKAWVLRSPPRYSPARCPADLARERASSAGAIAATRGGVERFGSITRSRTGRTILTRCVRSTTRGARRLTQGEGG
mmetsp:Transcript_4413/g.7270  ORF Transcript_4413/g.7270 Transcript_4413/m.7270 type:complete len:207 (-) Transcript_4413:36-656(-)